MYQPQAAAECIFRAAMRAPRELWVGAPVVQAVLGTMAGPGLLDRLLARTAYRQQQAARARDTDTGFDILDAPAATDHGIEGPYPAGARGRAHAVNPAALRGAVALALLGSFGIALLGRRG